MDVFHSLARLVLVTVTEVQRSGDRVTDSQPTLSAHFYADLTKLLTCTPDWGIGVLFSCSAAQVSVTAWVLDDRYGTIKLRQSAATSDVPNSCWSSINRFILSSPST